MYLEYCTVKRARERGVVGEGVLARREVDICLSVVGVYKVRIHKFCTFFTLCQCFKAFRF